MQGSLAGDIEQSLATDTVPARDRMQLFHLAWNAACSSFGTRQVLYERFYAGDPLTRARILNAIYPKQGVIQRALDFLRQEDNAT